MAAAEYIQTDTCLTGSVPSGAYGIIRDAQWGIDSTLSGYIIQNVTISHNRIYDTTQDQKGAVVSELDYDENYDMSMTVIGGNGSELGDLDGIEPGRINLVWANKTWKVRSVQYNGVYNGKKSYNITAFRAAKFPLPVQN